MKKIFFLVSVLFALSACATTQDAHEGASQVAAVSDEDLPKIVAVMPFQNETEEAGISSQVRKAFYNYFSSKSYRDVEQSVIDEKIVFLEKSTGKTILDIKPAEICVSIGCDGIIYGKVTNYTKVYAVAYSQLGVEAEVWMVDAKTGKELVRIKDSAKVHEGGVSLSPLGMIMTAVSTALNLREVQQIRIIGELAHKLNEKIPSPKGLKGEDMPKIKEVLSNVKDGPFGKGKVIKVGLDGEPGVVAMFDIGNFRKNIMMKETKPGIYLGEYLVMPGDNVSDMPIVTYLKRPGGLESQWIDVSGFVTIDTVAPSQVTNIKAKGFQDRIEITWDAVKNTPDLKTYSVLRSEQPLSGYSEIAKIEHNIFEDKTAKPDIVYYYRVTAYDKTGNESGIQDAVKASLASKEPVMISGELKKDTVLSGIFVIKGNLIVPKGLSLTLEPDTRMMFDEESSLIVYGKLIANAKDLPVEFIPVENKKWKGITVDSGSISFNGFRIKGAMVSLSVQSSEGSIENGVITNSDTGISVSGTPSVTAKNLTVSANKTGIELQKTDARVLQSSIFQNRDGIIIKNFSGEIKDNNIFDNEKNISSETTIKIAANYLGSVNTEEMKTDGIICVKVYDNRFPEGKIVDAFSNPYASLSQEDRQKKAAEIVIEAGNYFRDRNYGKAVTKFEEALKACPASDTYYYLAVSYQEMKEYDRAIKYLKEGVEKFPKDSTLQKSLGMMYYQNGKDAEAKKVFEEVIRLSPDDRQVKFLLERMGGK